MPDLYDALFHLLLSALVAVCGYALRRGRRHSRALLLSVLFGGTLLVGLLAQDPFHAMRLAAWLVFLYLPVFLLLLASAVWQEDRRSATASGVLVAMLCLVAIDAFLVEPHWLEVSHHRLAAPGLQRPLRLVVLADLQTDAVGEYERAVFRQVRELAPDLVLLPGDYLQLPARQRQAQVPALRALFEPLEPPLGIWAVGGNVDPPGWPALFEGTAVATFPRSGTVTLREDLRLTGLSLADSFSPALQVPPESGVFHILFGHAPDFALGDNQAQLLVAGHTHGGQVRLPGIGPLITLSQVPRAWAAGLTRLSGGRSLVVSRGIGMERGRAPRLRFFCRPELVVLDLVPDSPNTLDWSKSLPSGGDG
jgi:uncharacterized protein